MQELEAMDRDQLIQKLTESLPEIRSALGLSFEDLERMTGIGAKRLSAFEEKRQIPRWSEYLAIVFVLWSNEKSRKLLEASGLFPIELKKAFSMNKNAHETTV